MDDFKNENIHSELIDPEPEERGFALAGCCGQEWVECEYCGGEGVVEHDCGEDCCCCLDPEDNVVCDICGGEGGWYMCIGGCDKDGKHSERRKNE